MKQVVSLKAEETKSLKAGKTSRKMEYGKQCEEKRDEP